MLKYKNEKNKYLIFFFFTKKTVVIIPPKVKNTNTHSKNKSESKNKELLYLIYSTIISLLDNKIIINDLMLIFTFEICKIIGQSSVNKFLKTLNKCVMSCLSDNNDNNHNPDEKCNQSVRNYFYFKQYLLNSNIWLCKLDSDNNDGNNQLLFDMINKLTDNELMKQKQYIWDSIQNEEKNDNQNWNKLCNFKMNNKRKSFVLC